MVNVRVVATLLLNVVQSADDSAPRFDPDAVGKLNVCVAVAEFIAKSVPAVPTANVCGSAVNVFSVVMPPPASTAHAGKPPTIFRTYPFVPANNSTIRPLEL